MTRVSLPTYEEVCALPVELASEVPWEYLDVNGHMNVRHYMSLHDDASASLFSALGFTTEYIESTRRSFFDAEHHVRYLAEIEAGHALSVHTRLIARSAKAVHVMSFIVNRTRETLSNILEGVSIHVDLTSRRTIELGPQDAARVDRRLAQDQAIAWPAPLSGCIAVSRR